MSQIHTKNQMFNWLVSTCILLILLIWVGGFTRLTGSGLSITEWEVFSGILPPFTNEKWLEYFALYKEIPEYKKINYGMNLNEFKIIFWWESIQRFLARVLVLIYLIPLFYFILKKKLKIDKAFFFIIVLLLFFLQGFMGWYMVQSGLVSDTDVSHFRLAAHLSLAVIIYTLIFWSLLNINCDFTINFNLKSSLFLFLIFLILIQIIWGAFTSGLNAGLLYQTWPLMNNNFIADDIEVFKIFSIQSISNPSYVQFIHRLLAYIIIIYTACIYFFFFKTKKIWKPFKFIFIAIFIQISFGIITLISGLNIYLASLHQMGSIFLISAVIYGLFYINNSQNLIDT